MNELQWNLNSGGGIFWKFPKIIKLRHFCKIIQTISETWNDMEILNRKHEEQTNRDEAEKLNAGPEKFRNALRVKHRGAFLVSYTDKTWMGTQNTHARGGVGGGRSDMGWLKLVMEILIHTAWFSSGQKDTSRQKKTSYLQKELQITIRPWEVLDILVITTYVVGIINADWLHWSAPCWKTKRPISNSRPCHEPKLIYAAAD